VISHLEGCSGNFLGRLMADLPYNEQSFFRVDLNQDSHVLAINGRDGTWDQEIDSQLKEHTVVVTHNYDRLLIQSTFPYARWVSIYPYTHIGNVLYNICHKKLNVKLENTIDNHFLHLKIWFDKITKNVPSIDAMDYWRLRDKTSIEALLGKPLSDNQTIFFHKYWDKQLKYELDIPMMPMGILELVDFWKIQNDFTPWMIAWVVFVYEYINKLAEHHRLWSINDVDKFKSWTELKKLIEQRYQ